MTMNRTAAGPTVTVDDAAVDESRAMTVAACLFHGFSDPTRLAILRHLSLGEHRVVELTQHLGLAQSTVSTHLACLKDCGLVSSRPQGRASIWTLNHSDIVMDLLAVAERLLAATGDAVALCANYGVATLRTSSATVAANDGATGGEDAR